LGRRVPRHLVLLDVLLSKHCAVGNMVFTFGDNRHELRLGGNELICDSWLVLQRGNVTLGGAIQLVLDYMEGKLVALHFLLFHQDVHFVVKFHFLFG